MTLEQAAKMVRKSEYGNFLEEEIADVADYMVRYDLSIRDSIMRLKREGVWVW